GSRQQRLTNRCDGLFNIIKFQEVWHNRQRKLPTLAPRSGRECAYWIGSVVWKRDLLNQPFSPSLEEPTNPLPPADLAALPEPLRAAAARAGWTSLMPVQAQAIPYLL